jgi:LuxR family maltose regulon positive regulatory protein
METGKSLLLTRLFVPQVRPNQVTRPRLVARLNQALRGRLTLVSAPIGFGKPTLVSGWLQQREQPFTSPLSQQGDYDPARFLAYQAALHGLLTRVCDPGLTLLAIVRAEPEPK